MLLIGKPDFQLNPNRQWMHSERIVIQCIRKLGVYRFHKRAPEIARLECRIGCAS